MSEEPIVELSDQDLKDFTLFHTLQFSQTPTGDVEVGVIQVPVPKFLLEQFFSQFGEEMAKENMKLVSYEGKTFLAPIKTSSLIGFTN